MIDEGSNVTLTCTVIGNPRCTHMYWMYTTINGSYQETIQMPCSRPIVEFDKSTCTQIGKLVIANITLNDSGNYTCINGPELTAYVNIKVKPPGIWICHVLYSLTILL